jgi:translation initiation factor IF-2
VVVVEVESMKKNLVMHVYPKTDPGHWRRGVEHVRQRLSQFTGRRLVSVAIDTSTDTAAEVERAVGGEVEIREVFKVSKVGVVAGCMVTDGKIYRNSKVRLIRDGVVVYTGELSSLKRFKDDVKEVSSGYDCGLTIGSFNDLKEGDQVEAYEMVETKRKLK